VNLVSPSVRILFPIAPGFFQFALLRPDIKTTFPRSTALIAGGYVATA
jgi:hypothetical protein